MKLMDILKILVITAVSAVVFLAIKFGADNYYFPNSNAGHQEEAAAETDGHSEDMAAEHGTDDAPAEEATETAEVVETTEEVVVEVVEEVVEPTFADLLAVADAGAGARVFNKCKACHSDAAGENKVGPSLFGVIGRAAGTAEGFTRYSDPMLERTEEWTAEAINEFITKPRDFLAGTSMTYAGLRKIEDRANIIAYLATLQ